MKSGKGNSGRPIGVDLFCGVGGMSLGFEQAGFDIALGLDVDGHHVAAHERNFPYSVSLCRSILDVTPEQIRSLVGERDVDVIFGGPPCQGFSNMGQRDVADPRNTLVDAFAKLVEGVRPKTFVMENVPGMMTGKTRPIFERALNAFREAGYQVVEPVQVLDASHFGAPQKRRRLFVLGIRTDLGTTLSYPLPSTNTLFPSPTVWDAIGDLPDVDAHASTLTCNDLPYDAPPHSDFAAIRRGLRIDATDFSYRRQWSSDLCSGCLRVQHSEKAKAMYSATVPGRMVPGHKLPRLDPNGLSPTLRAGSDSAHGSHTAPRPVHPYRPRCITVREAARLHGFPDWFQMYPLKWHGYRQVGNAVCPPVAKAIASEILKSLRIVPRRPRITLQLGSAFDLPEDRPRQLKRITHIANYPPVIEHLFDRRYDRRRKRLKQATFTFADVSEAIAKTGVKLSWTRHDTFLLEIARSRNLKQILAYCGDFGYTLRALPPQEDGAIGEFVRIGEPGTIEDKEYLPVRSKDLNAAVELTGVSSPTLSDPASMLTFLSSASVAEVIWGQKRVRLQRANARTATRMKPYVVTISAGGTNPKTALVFPSPAGALPVRSSIMKSATLAETNDVIVTSHLTLNHILVSRFSSCQTRPSEIVRCVFKMPPTLASHKGRK